ncbi:MAG: HNH endonuclease [Rhodospirillales bacterium]|nr:HNH endonuclease [Rhodospirillales bacterium]
MSDFKFLQTSTVDKSTMEPIYTIVDAEDYDKFSHLKLRYNPSQGVVTTVGGRSHFLHRLIMKVEDSLHEIRHLDGNRLNNRKENLLVVDRREKIETMRAAAQKATSRTDRDRIARRKGTKEIPVQARIRKPDAPISFPTFLRAGPHLFNRDQIARITDERGIIEIELTTQEIAASPSGSTIRPARFDFDGEDAQLIRDQINGAVVPAPAKYATPPTPITPSADIKKYEDQIALLLSQIQNLEDENKKTKAKLAKFQDLQNAMKNL